MNEHTIDKGALSAPRPHFRRRSRPNIDGATPVIAPPSKTPAKTGYDVGYGKPPTQYRFKPGQSGNPKGRPKGARGLNALVREMLDDKVEIVIKGRPRKVSTIQALLLKLLEKAVKGDLRANSELIRRYQAAVPDPIIVPPLGESDQSIDDEADDAILAAFAEMIRAEDAAKRGGRS